MCQVLEMDLWVVHNQVAVNLQYKKEKKNDTEVRQTSIRMSHFTQTHMEKKT